MRSPQSSRRRHFGSYPSPSPSPRRSRTIGLRQTLLVLLGAAVAGLAAGSWEAIVGPPTAEAANPAASATDAGPGSSTSKPAPTVMARFGLCHTGGGTNCVVDGDTVWIGGEKIRV